MIDFSNNNPVALVTGASSGIGVHYAIELAKMRYNLILVSNQENQIKTIAAQIASQTGSEDLSNYLKTSNKGVNSDKQWITAVYKDLATPHAAEELFEFYPNVELLINNAGMFIFNDITDCSIQRIETIINLHILTITKLCRLFGERMRNNKKGYILNMSSISANTPFPGISLYSATKSYIRTFTKAFHYEMKEYGVKVIVVSPGAVATDLYNLPSHLQDLGIKLGIIYHPQKLAIKALSKLLKGKKEFIPGYINRFFIFAFALVGGYEKIWIRKKIKRFMK